jgi:hypothetical protein
MLRRVVRWIIAGVALALALHLYMLSGHSHQAQGPLAPLEAASHQGVAAAHRHGMGAYLHGLERAVDMLASCLAIVGTLLLGTSFRRRIRPPSPTGRGSGATPSPRPPTGTSTSGAVRVPEMSRWPGLHPT